MDPQPTWEELAEFYTSSYGAYDPSYGVGEDESAVVEKALETRKFRQVTIQPGMRVLDVGCGGGSFLRIARRMGAIVKGVEPSSIAAARTRAQGIDVFEGTLDQYVETEGDKGEFDLITASHVLEHVPRPVDTLRQMKSLLAPGGQICISVPNAANPFARTLKGRWFNADLPLHLMQFTPRSLEEASRHAGLKAVRRCTSNWMPGMWGSVLLFLRVYLLIPRKLSSRFKWLERSMAPRLANWLDRREAGEELHCWFVGPETGAGK
jgi:2-polyprenyl-3-methyl-5-hydroxy-6-metoxy-1,4-benzoquinol methylase